MSRDPDPSPEADAGSPEKPDLSELIEYPCTYTFKAIGLDAPDFESHVRTLVGQVLGMLPKGASTSRVSSGGKYRSVSVYCRLDDEAQRREVYRLFHVDDRVVYSL